MEQVEISVEELLSGLKRRGLPLPFEIGAFIALEACEQILDQPMRLDARDIGIGDIGEVVCTAKKTPVTEESAARALMLLLSELLVCSAPGVPAMLLELVERGPSTGEWTLERVRDDLEACLVPLNRGATRRVLARLTREARKAGLERASRPSVVPAAAEIDAQFDAMMEQRRERPPSPGPRPAAKPALKAPRASATAFAVPAVAAPAPPPLASPTPRGIFTGDDAPTLELDRKRTSESSQAASLRALRSAASSAPPAIEAEPEPQPSAAERGPARRAPAEVAARRELLEDYGPHERAVSGGPVDDLLADMPERERSRVPMLIGWGLAIVAVALAGAYLALGQTGARRVLGLAPIADAPLPELPAQRPAKAAGELRVTSEPARAQVFLFVGNGPTVATDLPIGVAQEFVAMAEGFAPTRAIVPSDAQWEQVSGSVQPRYELAMQAGRLDSPDQALELGPTLLQPDVGAPSGRLGSVRVITTPKAAKVYQLIGFTPDVRVENLPLDSGYEVLVYLPGYGLQTRRIEPGDFRELEGRRVADVSLQLTAARARR